MNHINHIKNIIELNNKKYFFIKFIGKGKGGYSYLVTDDINETNKNKFVLKQIHHEPCDYYKFNNKIQAELSDYKQLKKINIKIPELIDYDLKYERILKEYINGKTISELISMDSLHKKYIDQVRYMSKIAKDNNLNIDYYPTNFVVDKNDIVFYIDYECNLYDDKWSFDNWGIKYYQ